MTLTRLRALLAAATEDDSDATNTALIVAAHNALPALLDCVEHMQSFFAKYPHQGSKELRAALKRLEGGE